MKIMIFMLNNMSVDGSTDWELSVPKPRSPGVNPGTEADSDQTRGMGSQRWDAPRGVAPAVEPPTRYAGGPGTLVSRGGPGWRRTEYKGGL